MMREDNGLRRSDYKTTTAVLRSMRQMKEWFRGSRSFLRPWATLSLIYLTGIWAILRADFYYVDDMARASEGYRGWTTFSRWIAEYGSVLVHADTYLTDISPLPQILAVMITAAAGMILLYSLTDSETVTVWQLTALVPFGLSPYYLECLSYKFDSPYMALSVFFSVLPLLFRKRRSGTYIFAAALSAAAMCCCYQAASGIFPLAVLWLGLHMWLQRDESAMRFVRDSAAGYILGILGYRFLLMKPAENYVSNSVPGIRELIPTALAHLRKYYSTVRSDFKTGWMVILAVLILCWLASAVRQSKRGAAAAAAAAVLTLAVMSAAAFGLYPLLENPLFLPRAMYGFGVWISILALEVVSSGKMIPGKLACAALAWVFLVFGFSYGNALNLQKQYADFRMTMVVEDLDDLGLLQKGKTRYIQISGSIGRAPAIRSMPEDHRLLKRMVPVTFHGKNSWGSYMFFHYYGLKHVREKTAEDAGTRRWKVIKRSAYHTIEKSGRYIRISLIE